MSSSVTTKNEPFTQKKRYILDQLAQTDAENTDASPKGTVDEHLLGLINLINLHPDMVTTSSCSGRLSVFLEGEKSIINHGSNRGSQQQQQQEEEEEDEVESREKIGGKGAGGKWLYVTHEPEDVISGLEGGDGNKKWWWPAVKSYTEVNSPGKASGNARRYVLYKFEAMVCCYWVRQRECVNANE